VGAGASVVGFVAGMVMVSFLVGNLRVEWREKEYLVVFYE